MAIAESAGASGPEGKADLDWYRINRLHPQLSVVVSYVPMASPKIAYTDANGAPYNMPSGSLPELLDPAMQAALNCANQDCIGRSSVVRTKAFFGPVEVAQQVSRPTQGSRCRSLMNQVAIEFCYAGSHVWIKNMKVESSRCGAKPRICGYPIEHNDAASAPPLTNVQIEVQWRIPSDVSLPVRVRSPPLPPIVSLADLPVGEDIVMR